MLRKKLPLFNNPIVEKPLLQGTERWLLVLRFLRWFVFKLFLLIPHYTEPIILINLAFLKILENWLKMIGMYSMFLPKSFDISMSKCHFFSTASGLCFNPIIEWNICYQLADSTLGVLKYKSHQYYESKVLHNTEVTWFSTAHGSLKANYFDESSYKSLGCFWMYFALFVSCLSAICQLYVSCLSAVYQLFINCLSAFYQLFVS